MFFSTEHTCFFCFSLWNIRALIGRATSRVSCPACQLRCNPKNPLLCTAHLTWRSSGMFFPSIATGDVLSCLTHEKCELILHCHVNYGHPEDINIAQRFSGFRDEKLKRWKLCSTHWSIKFVTCASPKIAKGRNKMRHSIWFSKNSYWDLWLLNTVSDIVEICIPFNLIDV